MDVADSCQGLDVGFMGLGYAKVAVLGVVQGITELLPISSTAHMRVVPALLGWPDPGAAFSATMQAAALVAVVSYFWRDIAGICNERRNVVGLMPHPEDAIETLLGSTDGRVLFESMVHSLVPATA